MSRQIIAYVENETLETIVDSSGDGLLKPREGWREQLADAVKWGEREPLESDPSRKQLIAYCPVRLKGRVFAYLRAGDISESRLGGLWSVGWGGHIEPPDIEGRFPESGLWRELNEELNIRPDAVSEEKLEGMILSDDNEVGSVHLGIVYSVDISEEGAVQVAETDKHPVAEWHDVNDVGEGRSFEDWSETVLGHLRDT